MMIDKLDKIFRLQKKLDNRLGVYERDWQIQIDDNYIALVHELNELHDLTNWKKWKKTHKNKDITHALEEYVDLIHFVVQLGLIWGFTPKDIYNGYISKNKVNHERQDNNY